MGIFKILHALIDFSVYFGNSIDMFKILESYQIILFNSLFYKTDFSLYLNFHNSLVLNLKISGFFKVNQLYIYNLYCVKNLIIFIRNFISSYKNYSKIFNSISMYTTNMS